MPARHNVPLSGRGRLARTVFAVSLFGGWMTAAMAQTPPSSPAKPQIPEKVAPPLEDGVIKPPPDVDPGMSAKPPDTDKGMPVIPPPGSPGGEQSVKPK